MKISLLIAGLALVCSACRQQPKGTVIARVGDAELTLETARLHIDTTRGAAGVQLRKYASSWITTELLYQEASRHGIENTPEFRQQLADVQRELATERYLATVLAGERKEIDEDTLKGYYLTHAKEFLLHENMIKLHIMISTSREQASSFAASVVQKGNWSNAARSVIGDSTRSGGAFTEVPAQYYSQPALYPPELWKVASSLSINEVSFPVRAGENYYVLQLLTTAQQGKTAEYEIIRDEVRQRIIIERKRKQYSDLLGNLRSKYTVELLLNGIAPSDSLQTPAHE